MPPFHGIWISLFQILLFSWSSCRDGAGRRRSHGASPPFLMSSSGTIPRVETRGNNHTGQRAAGKRRLEPSPSSPLVLLCKSQLCQAVNSPKPSGSPPSPFSPFLPRVSPQRQLLGGRPRRRGKGGGMESCPRPGDGMRMDSPGGMMGQCRDLGSGGWNGLSAGRARRGLARMDQPVLNQPSGMSQKNPSWGWVYGSLV